MIKYNSAYVTLLSTWLILGTIVNPTKMLPYASILMTFISFVGAKYATLISIREEARDVIQDIVKDEFQRMVSKTDIQKMNVPMSQKVLSAIVVGDVDALASTALSIDVIHDTIAPLKAEIGNVCDVLGVDENIIRTVASGNTEEIAKIALNKLDVDPNLFTLMVSIARKDINASVKAFRKVSVAVLGRRDELLSDLCESIIQILMKKEGSEMSEVILKKIVTKLLLYTKPKMLSEIEARVKNNKDEVKISPEEIKEGMSHINTDLIFALNALKSNQSSEVLLELLALILRTADEKLYSILRKHGTKYKPMFAQIFKLCKEIYFQRGNLKSAICNVEKPGQLLTIFLQSIIDHFHQDQHKLTEDPSKKITKAFHAISELATTSDSFQMRKLISDKITDVTDGKVDENVQSLIADVIETGIAVIAIDGAVNIEECINRVIKKITILPQYKQFVKEHFGEIYANKLMVACQMFTSVIFPRSLQILSGIDGVAKQLSFSDVKERKILSQARSIITSLMNHPDVEIICNGVPLIQEIERRGEILITTMMPFFEVSELDRKSLKLFVNLFCAKDELVRRQMGVLWTSIGFSNDVKNVLNAVMECCIFQRNANLCNIVDVTSSRIRATELLLKSLKVILDDETNSKWKQKLGPVLLIFCEKLEEKDFDQLNDDTFCQEFHDDIFNVWPRLKLLLTVSLSPPQIYISIFFRSKLSNIFLKMNKYFTC